MKLNSYHYMYYVFYIYALGRDSKIIQAYPHIYAVRFFSLPITLNFCTAYLFFFPTSDKFVIISLIVVILIVYAINLTYFDKLRTKKIVEQVMVETSNEHNLKKIKRNSIGYIYVSIILFICGLIWQVLLKAI
jgi:hypothetical protein